MAITFGTPVETFIATEASPQTINLETGAVAGDVRVVALNHSPDGTAAIGTITIPAGWTQIGTNTNTGAASDSKLTLMYRVWQSGDADTVAVTTSTNMTVGAIAVNVKGVDTTNVLDQTVPAMSTGTHPISSPSITTVTDNAAVLSAGVQDGTTGAIDDTDVPTGMTVLGTMANNPPSNGMNLGLAFVIQATLGASGVKTWQTNTGSEERVGATFALRPVVGPTITDVETDEEFDDGDTALTITGTTFEAVQGTGTVEISDNAVYATGTKVAQTVTSWGATSIDFTAVLGALAPGPLWLWVTNDSGQRNTAFVVTVHRKVAFVLSASANIAAGGENTTARLTAPGGKTTGDFDAGRIADDENPSDASNISLDDYSEDVISFEATDDAEPEQYQFRILIGGNVPDNSPVDPRLTVLAGGGYSTLIPMSAKYRRAHLGR